MNKTNFSLLIGAEIAPELIEIFDSTTINLFKEILKGAGRNAIDGKKKGGLKVITKIDFPENVPNYICIKAASANETGFLKLMEMEKGSIGVMDKGFNKYFYFDLLDKSGRFFVTRKNANACYDVLETRAVEQGSDIVKNQVILLKYKD